MEQAKQFQSPLRKILFCTDFSENADFAFDFALDAAVRRTGCELHLLHVVPESDAQFWKSYMYEVEGVDDKAKRDVDAVIDQKYRSRVPQNIPFIVEYRVGSDSGEILDYAKQKEIDLIVLGRQGQSGLKTVLFGRVTEKVARHAPCAVLIIPLTYQKRIANSQ
jgi:nucleotide-binding universal stress UspA family protein